MVLKAPSIHTPIEGYVGRTLRSLGLKAKELNYWLLNIKTYYWRLGMGILALNADERVQDVYFTEYKLMVELMDGRGISVPLAWYPKLFNATLEQRQTWDICEAGYGIHWPDIDEDLSTEGLHAARRTGTEKTQRS